MNQFSIDVSWLPETNGAAEERLTAASLTISVGDWTPTRIDDSWSKSVHNSTRVSAYPLALWLASSWWRLRWESAPIRSIPDISWKMSHAMPAAGGGYLWPNLTFESDGDQIFVVCRPSNPLANEPIRYLENFQAVIPASLFQSEIDAFIRLTLARLDAVRLSSTPLHEIWSEVLGERHAAEVAYLRGLEARLGFDPSEAPEDLLQRMSLLAGVAGSEALEEIAAACAGSRFELTFRQITEFAALPGTTARIPRQVGGSLGNTGGQLPWHLGRQLAQDLRRSFDLGQGPIRDDQLAGILEIPVQRLREAQGLRPRSPVGLAIRLNGGDSLKLLFRKHNRPGLRFEAARFLAEQALVPAAETWLPATDSKSSRQKIQRSFAAEFLCPIETLTDFLDGDYSPELVEEAAERFGVSELAVETQLVNHGLLSHEQALF